MDESTICAISTALGTGAISIIRCSGKDAISIVNKIFKGKDLNKVESHTINYGFIIDEQGEKIDEVLVNIMKSPKTFTREDVVEINVHGGISTTNKVLELLLINGCKLAEPGEFTKRAFLNGRIDLVEAEAVGDIILAETDKARKLAINQITGSLSSKIEEIRSKIIALQSEIEVNIDFPEYEEAEEYTLDTIIPKLKELQLSLKKLLKNAENGKIVRNGLNIALIGKPNVGKSSILNNLLEEQKAIVTSIPGTTRDIVEGKISLNGIELNLIDTAGIRDTKDIVEQIGVEKSKKISQTSDLIIYVLDNSIGVTKDDLEFLTTQKEKVIIFINKDDINSNNKYDELSNYNIVYGNTLSSKGLENLKNKIIELFEINKLETTDYSFISNARQLSLVKLALESINNSLKNTEMRMPIDMYTIDLNNAYNYLGQIIGKTYEEDLLDELFSRFCLGK